MKRDHTLQKAPLPKREEHLLNVLGSSRFLNNQGLSNELPIFICPFLPQERNDLLLMQKRLVANLKMQGVTVLEVDLYDLAIEILQGRRIWERILEREPLTPPDRLLESLQNTLDPENHLVPAIGRKMTDSDGFDILFLSGVGELYPYVRSHLILNQLPKVMQAKPILLFFPGDYSQSNRMGSSLNLFGRFPEDNYYRAFNIYHYDV